MKLIFRASGVRALLGVALACFALSGASCTWARMSSAYVQVRDMSYVRDANGDSWQTPAETARRGAGDCEDKALYLQHLLRQSGIDAQVIFGIQNTVTSKTGHAWVECEVDGKVYMLDPSGKLRIARRELESWEYYPVHDSPQVLAKVKRYIERTGQRGFNRIYEAAIAAQESSAPASAPAKD